MPRKRPSRKSAEFELRNVISQESIPEAPDGRPAFHVASYKAVATFFRTSLKSGLADDDHMHSRLKAYGKNALQSNQVRFVQLFNPARWGGWFRVLGVFRQVFLSFFFFFFLVVCFGSLARFGLSSASFAAKRTSSNALFCIFIFFSLQTHLLFRF
jgi:hypothetical protein